MAACLFALPSVQTPRQASCDAIFALLCALQQAVTAFALVSGYLPRCSFERAAKVLSFKAPYVHRLQLSGDHIKHTTQHSRQDARYSYSKPLSLPLQATPADPRLSFCSLLAKMRSALLLTCLIICSTALPAPDIAPTAAVSPCVDIAPDCEAVCNKEPGNVEEACSLQTPIGAYLR